MEKNKRKPEKSAENNKKMNLELLRCVAMMMVVVLHFLGKGGLLGELAGADMGVTGTIAWIPEVLCIVAVNLYMLLSGYLLCESSFKLSRFLGLLLQIWTYSVVFGLAAVGLGLVPAEDLTTYYYVRLLFPVSMGHYWFMTAYVFLYLLLPFLTPAVKHMSKKQMQLSIGLLLLFFCGLKSVLPLRLDMDEKGYDCLWYLCVFLVAAYVRKFGIPFLEKKGRGLWLYFAASVLTFSGMMLLRMVYLKTGSLGLLLGVCQEYNHLLVLLAALGLFLAFLGWEVKGVLAKLAGKAGPLTLGVYLLHENLGFRYVWPFWLGADRIESVIGLLAGLLAAVVAVFTAGIAVEAIRLFLMGWLHRGLLKTSLYRKIWDGIQKADALFRE